MAFRQLPAEAGVSYALIDGVKHLRGCDVARLYLPEREQDLASGVISQFAKNNPAVRRLVRKGTKLAGWYFPDTVKNSLLVHVQNKEVVAQARAAKFAGIRSRKEALNMIPSTHNFTITELNGWIDGREVPLARVERAGWPLTPIHVALDGDNAYVLPRDVADIVYTGAPTTAKIVAVHAGKGLDGVAIKFRATGAKPPKFIHIDKIGEFEKMLGTKVYRDRRATVAEMIIAGVQHLQAKVSVTAPVEAKKTLAEKSPDILSLPEKTVEEKRPSRGEELFQRIERIEVLVGQQIAELRAENHELRAIVASQAKRIEELEAKVESVHHEVHLGFQTMMGEFKAIAGQVANVTVEMQTILKQQPEAPSGIWKIFGRHAA